MSWLTPVVAQRLGSVAVSMLALLVALYGEPRRDALPPENVPDPKS